MRGRCVQSLSRYRRRQSYKKLFTDTKRRWQDFWSRMAIKWNNSKADAMYHVARKCKFHTLIRTYPIDKANILV